MQLIYKFLLIIIILSNQVLAAKEVDKLQEETRKAPEIITIYSTSRFTNDWGIGPIIKKMFEKEYNAEIKFIAFDGANSLINRLRFEKDNVKADLVLGLDATQLSSEPMKKLLAPHNIDLKILNNLPLKWKDKIFIPYNYGFLSFIYRDGAFKNIPKNFKELIDSEEKFKIAISNPKTSDTGFDLLSWTAQVFEDKFDEEWKRLNEKIFIYAKGWSDAWNLCMLGEVDVVLSYDTSAGYHKYRGKEHLFKEMIFNDGHIIYLQIGAKTKKAADREIVQNFFEFLFKPEIQSIMLKYNYTHPVVKVNNNVDYTEVNNRKILFDAGDKIVNHGELIKRWVNAVM